MTRTNQLPENTLAQMVSKLRTDLDELKNQQRTSGRSGVLGYFLQSTSSMVTVGNDSSSATLLNADSVQFTGDGSQLYPVVNLTMNIYANGTLLQPVGDNLSWTDGTRSSTVTGISYTYSGNTTHLDFLISTFKQVTYVLEAFAYASCSGTLTLV
jgi:hypothetical protein